jgi:predicted nucleic acid-binding protein
MNESHSDDVENYIQRHGPVAISDLTIVEMRCLLSRRRREKSLTTAMEAEIFAAFQEDIRRRFLICHPFPEGLAMGAVNLMAFLPDVPVRTLDAMHVVIAREIGAGALATADRIMAEAGKALSLKVAKF